MKRFLDIYIGILCLTLQCYAETELLKNSDFESTSFSGNWHAADCRLTPYTADKYHGSRCVKVSNRHHDWSAARQDVSLTGGQWYSAKSYIKFLNMPAGVPYVFIDVIAAIHVDGHTKYQTLGQIPMQQEKYGWTEVGGDFFAPNGTTGATFYIQVHNSAVNYLQDFSSLQRIPSNPNWKSEAITRINATRKAPITVGLANGASATGISIELQQQKHSFGFGAGVVADMMTNPNQQAYQNFVYKNFEWAVIVNALKWRLMEWSKGHINFARPVNAIKALQAHGIKIRGHNMFWGVNGHVPAWMEGKSATEYVSEMKLHVHEVVSHTRGTLEHWDVNNENMHGDYFERHTGDPDITAKMFQWIHSEEPNVKLFINEYNIITNSQSTTATRNQAIQLRNMGIPVYGVGIQGHFHSSNIDIDVVKYRLDKVAESGLKIWITELTVSESDANKKAAALENLLTLFYSHPAVEGVILWTFWDGAIRHSQDKLFEGPNFTPNAAGQKYIDLVHKAWNTSFTHAISAHNKIHTSGFLGDYVLNVKRDGNVIHQEQFSLDSAGKHLTVHLTGDQHVSHVAFGR
ncbi:anti-sigma-I factor RsgI6-like [Ostrea edulis]|uniref:anti-sigma-I factor RsgI6-like n=1 Tax=Ostrea edulis TaxID=37623 RepID=UPI0024AEDB56|nr:anti-sigma-I factor RsgI6-like [Ostrea edulis]